MRFFLQATLYTQEASYAQIPLLTVFAYATSQHQMPPAQAQPISE